MGHPEDLKYKIGLSLIPGIGFALVKNLVAYVGSTEGVFREKEKNLLKIPGIGEVNSRRIVQQNVLEQAEQEIEFISKNGIDCLFYLDEKYPKRLRNCHDAPIVLFSKGNANLNESRIISMVGTRNATVYGKELCDSFIKALSERSYPALVVSGLAYGIDVAVHKACLKYNVSTVGVLAHGLDQLYPSLHKPIASKMLENGGLVSDFMSGTEIERQNFLQRNRIIAGMADVSVIVESAEKGGALVTADIANSYNRDVCAFPGRADDTFSRGCNKLIKSNEAAMIENLEDLELLMGWETKKEMPTFIQKQLFVELTEHEQKIVHCLSEGEQMIDVISKTCEMPAGRVSALLLDLEFKGLVASLPGKMFRLR
ncbi:MAG: DNA protecting protein DprA [Bacteroidetes bacterium GWF2_42_66]|nr:MAG: DNA protecting protein DprA [Bacteroidetes bacterium GWA2_42_15]OFX97112.1 MAG: DNA protecting protein DprA [Bacteroidetes bacterium GWE2_42_39]OFY46183.1 MAG: DNA protecting protein DprA [Bacteroidetes bacterium GWF2_42_66]HBL78051.1 DNA-protecting protein DprA [Prolixibacteraceae bacterium]HCR89859.1 DNA-protecting protein DprA [Prolixibacteraceae bacterium]